MALRACQHWDGIVGENRQWDILSNEATRRAPFEPDDILSGWQWSCMGVVVSPRKRSNSTGHVVTRPDRVSLHPHGLNFAEVEIFLFFSKHLLSSMCPLFYDQLII